MRIFYHIRHFWVLIWYTCSTSGFSIDLLIDLSIINLTLRRYAAMIGSHRNRVNNVKQMCLWAKTTIKTRSTCRERTSPWKYSVMVNLKCFARSKTLTNKIIHLTLKQISFNKSKHELIIYEPSTLFLNLKEINHF